MPSNEFEALPKDFDGKHPWERCPSTHCERRQECCSPHECSGTGIAGLIRQAKIVSTPAQLRAKATYRAKQKAKVERMEEALRRFANAELFIPENLAKDDDFVMVTMGSIRQARQALEVKP